MVQKNEIPSHRDILVKVEKVLKPHVANTNCKIEVYMSYQVLSIEELGSKKTRFENFKSTANRKI